MGLKARHEWTGYKSPSHFQEWKLFNSHSSDSLNCKYTENINFLKIGRFWLWGAIALESWEYGISRDLYLYYFGVQ